MATTETIEARWCAACGSHVTRCKHRKRSSTNNTDPLDGLAQVADDVERGAKAAAVLARGVRATIADAAGILGGRWGKK